MTKRTEKRMQALGYILSDGLTYGWFDVLELDCDAVTAKLRVEVDTDEWKIFDITADDVARGLRMYREWCEGKREGYPGEWAQAAGGNTFCRAEGEPIAKGAYAWQTVMFDRTNGDDGDYDANTADNVMQFATIGHAIYG
jgi:hypothetical protein